METQEKFKTYADVFGELPRNVQYNLRGAVCKTLNIKASDFYRLLAYAFDGTEKYGRGTFFYVLNGFLQNINKIMFLRRQAQAIKSMPDPLVSMVKNEREYIIQARNEAVIQNRSAPELYPETFLKPYWNETKTAMVTRHGVTHTQCPRPLNKSGRSVVNTFDGQVMSGASMFFLNKQRSSQYYTAV